MELLIFVSLAAAFAGALLAHHKTRRVALWAAICLFLPVTVIVLFLLPALRECPRCAVQVKRFARACNSCGYAFAHANQRIGRSARDHPFHPV